MAKDTPQRIDADTAKLAGAYLFQTPNDESQALDMRTNINGDQMMKMLMYYGVMGEIFGASDASAIKDIVERMLISFSGLGRQQAVDTLRQNFPKRVEVETGGDGSFDE